MKFDIHYINLDHEEERKNNTYWNLVLKFKDHEPKRFKGIYGKDVSNNEMLSSLGSYLCSHKMIGCGLSHIELAKTLVDSENDFNLIFEDDIMILGDPSMNVEEYIISEIERINLETQNSWDIIKFHNIGIIGFTGSTAAYAISKSGAKKLSKQKLHFHIDVLMNNGYDLHVIDNKIFNTDDQFKKYNNPLYNLKLFNQKFGWYMNQDVVSDKLKAIHVMISIIFVFFLCFFYKTFEIFTAYFVILLSFIIYIFKLSNILQIPKTYNIGIIQYVTFVFAYTIIQMSKKSHHSLSSEYVLYFTIFILCIHLLHKHSS